MATSKARTIRLVLAAALLLAACHRGTDRNAARPAPPPDRPWPAAALRSGGAPEAAALAPGQVHTYRLPLKKDTLLRLVVEQQGIDVEVALKDPGGKLLLSADRLINDRGQELVLAVAAWDGDYTLSIQGLPDSHPGRYAARIAALRPASAADRRAAAAYQTLTAARDPKLKPQEAIARCTSTVPVWQELGDTALEGEADLCIAARHKDLGERQEAADLFRQAALLLARAGDRHWEGIAHSDRGAMLLDLGDDQEAAAEYGAALPLVERAGNRPATATALYGLGRVSEGQGDLQTALDRFNAALALLPPKDSKRPNVLHSLGVLHARYLHDESQGRELLQQALSAWGPKQDAPRARTLSQLGHLAYEQGERADARRFYAEALELRKESDRCGSAVYLARLALVEEGRQADERLAEALRTVAAQPCPKSEPTVHRLAAELAERRGDAAAAGAAYQRSATLLAAQGDRLGVAESLEGVARSERALGDLKAARAAGGRVLAIVEGVRPTVLRDDLRTSFFAGARQAFDFQIGLLREMGADEEAWSTAERARARALGDLLAEAGAGVRDTADPALAAREQALQRHLNTLQSQWLQAGESHPEKLQALRQNIDAQVAELESLRGELRRRSPRYASFLQPAPVSLAAVRRELLDADTALLEYRLGDEASTLWMVTREALTAVRLPPRREIEPVAREAASWSRSREWRPGSNPLPLCTLSRMLLAPAAPVLGHRRLVVVADGALETLSFAALPVPDAPAACAGARPLVEAHEIAYLPSAATLLTQRHLLAGRSPAPGWLAAVADPVYTREDERLRGRTVSAETRGGGGGVGPSLARLPGSADEAREIAVGLPAGKVSVVTGFAASRTTVLSGALRGFRILHFAVHGLLDSEQPLLSALAFSQFDPAGRPVAGLLPAHDIYGLDLPAELVVLSACDTALGREVAGEGLVSGLPRAFLYAGSARVVVSLWPVDDRSTRDLMALFYRGLFTRQLAPSQALQEAQRALAAAGRPPYQWAGFVLLGDWRPLPPFSEHPSVPVRD